MTIEEYYIDNVKTIICNKKGLPSKKHRSNRRNLSVNEEIQEKNASGSFKSYKL